MGGGGTGRWRKNSLLLLPLRFPLSLLVAKENGASYDVYCSLVSAEARWGIFRPPLI